MTNGKKLAPPVRPDDTENIVAYEVLQSTYKATVTLINISNNTSEEVTFRVFHVSDGEIVDEGTNLFWDTPIVANGTYQIEVPYELDKIDDQLLVRTSVADALTFFVYGRLHDAG